MMVMRLLAAREAICETTARRLEELISKLDQNEDLIRGIMEQAK